MRTKKEFLEWLGVNEGDSIKIEGYEKLFIIEIDVHGSIWLKYSDGHYPIYSLVGIQYEVVNPKDKKGIK